LRHRGRSLAQAHREFAAWNLFTGERDDGQHYASGRSLPAAPLAAMGPETPFRVDPAESIDPLGAAAYRVPGTDAAAASTWRSRRRGDVPRPTCSSSTTAARPSRS